jgi:hypothetical protein
MLNLDSVNQILDKQEKDLYHLCREAAQYILGLTLPEFKKEMMNVRLRLEFLAAEILHYQNTIKMVNEILLKTAGKKEAKSAHGK